MECIIEMEGIKMVSGQPPMQQPYPMYQPVYQPPHKTSGEYLKPLASNLVLGLSLVLGLFLMWLGSLIYGVSIGSGGDGWKWGVGVKSVGMLLVTGVMLLAGLVRSDVERAVRAALIIAGVALIIVVGFWSSGMWSVP